MGKEYVIVRQWSQMAQKPETGKKTMSHQSQLN